MIILGSIERIWLKYTVCLHSMTKAKAASWEPRDIKVIAGDVMADLMDCALRKCKADLGHRVWETQTTDALAGSVAHQMVRLVMPLH